MVVVRENRVIKQRGRRRRRRRRRPPHAAQSSLTLPEHKCAAAAAAAAIETHISVGHIHNDTRKPLLFPANKQRKKAKGDVNTDSWRESFLFLSFFFARNE